MEPHFQGKYLTHACGLYNLCTDPATKASLKSRLAQVVGALKLYQAADGYLGPWSDSNRWGTANWDSWGHYHVLYGLIRYFEITRVRPLDSVSWFISNLVIFCFFPQCRSHETG